MEKLSLNINGKIRSIQCDEDTPLLWVIRDHLNLTGTKYSCGIGLCGNCVVHIDGVAERSCTIPVGSVKSKSVLTIEGLAQNKDNPIFKTWIEMEVSQCGYCQPGQIMTLAALLNQNPNQSLEEVEVTMSGVLCRCGTYPRIKKAIKKIISEEMLKK